MTRFNANAQGLPAAKFRIICFLLILLSTTNVLNCIGHTVPEDTIKIELQKAAGVGPQGFSMGIIPITALSVAEQAIIPHPIQKPAALYNAVEYYYVYNREQFLYQGLTTGHLTKEQFLVEAMKIGMNLKDTISLSVKPIRAGIYVLRGQDIQGKEIYYVDSNNDNDFEDEAAFLLPVGPTVKASIGIPIDYFEDGRTITEDVQCSFYVYQSHKELIVAFPEFKYAKLLIKNKSYVLCVNYSHAYPKQVYLLPDSPYFAGVGNRGIVALDKALSPAITDITLRHVSAGGSLITLSGPGVKYINIPDLPGDEVPTGKASRTVSRSLGFLAPAASGIDILSSAGNKISLHDLKGKYVFVDIWSTTCVPCIEDFPGLKELYDYYKRDQFEIIGIVDERGKGSAKKVLNRNAVDWPNLVMHSRGNMLDAYSNIYQFPTTYLLDPSGKIIAANLNARSLSAKLSVLLHKK